MTRTILLALALSLSAPLVACDTGGDKAADKDDDGKDKDKKKKKKDKDKDGDEDKDKDEEKDDGEVGLKAPSNDKAVVKLAEAAMKCEWKDLGFKWDCEDFKTWTKADELKDGKADETLVNLLEDKDEKVRFLAAKGLNSFGKEYEKDKKLAGRVLDAAENEKSKAVASNLGGVVGSIDAKETGTKDRLEKLASDHDLPEFRSSIFQSLQFNNRDEFYEFTKGRVTDDKDDKVRLAAMNSFWTGTPSGKYDDVCAFWLKMVDDKNAEISAKAAYFTGFFPSSGGCADQWDPLMDKIEGFAKEGQVTESNHSYALKYLHDHKEATDAHKKRAVEVAMAILENDKNKGTARSSALEFLAKEGGKGKALATKYKDDKEFFVKSAAKRIIEGK